MSRLGIYASQISGHLTPSTGFVSIATFTPTSGTSITFNSIPQVYKHLQLRMLVMQSGTASDVCIKLNSNVGVGSHYIQGRNTTASAGRNLQDATNGTLMDNYNSNTASIGWAAVTDLLDYTNTNKYKVWRNLQGYEQNTTNSAVGLVSGLHEITAAVTTITITLAGGASFTTGTSIALYGIQG